MSTYIKTLSAFLYLYVLDRNSEAHGTLSVILTKVERFDLHI